MQPSVHSETFQLQFSISNRFWSTSNAVSMKGVGVGSILWPIEKHFCYVDRIAYRVTCNLSNALLQRPHTFAVQPPCHPDRDHDETIAGMRRKTVHGVQIV